MAFIVNVVPDIFISVNTGEFIICNICVIK